MKMSGAFAVSSSLIKKAIPLYALSSTTGSLRPSSLLQTFNSVLLKKVDQAPDYQNLVHASVRLIFTGPDDLPAKSPPDVPAAPPFHKPGIPPEVPRRANVPDFDAIAPKNQADPPPTRPGPAPEFPGPPNPSPPKPEAPQPPIPPSPPGKPEVFPPHGPEIIPPKPPDPGEWVPPPKPGIDIPHGPDVIPPKPPEPGFPHPTQPDIPLPITM